MNLLRRCERRLGASGFGGAWNRCQIQDSCPWRAALGLIDRKSSSAKVLQSSSIQIASSWSVFQQITVDFKRALQACRQVSRASVIGTAYTESTLKR